MNGYAEVVRISKYIYFLEKYSEIVCYQSIVPFPRRHLANVSLSNFGVNDGTIPFLILTYPLGNGMEEHIHSVEVRISAAVTTKIISLRLIHISNTYFNTKNISDEKRVLHFSFDEIRSLRYQRLLVFTKIVRTGQEKCVSLYFQHEFSSGDSCRLSSGLIWWFKSGIASIISLVNCGRGWMDVSRNIVPFSKPFAKNLHKKQE